MMQNLLFSITLGFTISWIMDRTKYNSQKEVGYWVLCILLSIIGNILFQSLQ